MGDFINTALVVTNNVDYSNDVEKAHKIAQGLGFECLTSVLVGINGTRSFAILPHGSKVNRDTTKEETQKREVLKRLLNENCLSWVEVDLPGERTARVTDSSDFAEDLEEESNIKERLARLKSRGR